MILILYVSTVSYTYYEDLKLIRDEYDSDDYADFEYDSVNLEKGEGVENSQDMENH